MEVCRTCLNSSAIMTHILSPLKETVDEHKESQCVANIVNEFMGCELVSNDEFPQFVCESCINIAKIALSFKRMAEKSHQHFFSQQTKVLVAKKEIKVECEDLELNAICDLIDFEDLAMEDTLNEEHNLLNKIGHQYNTRGMEQNTKNNNGLKKLKHTSASIKKQGNSSCMRAGRENKPPKRALGSDATEESYPCPYCKFNSSTKGNLKTHIRTHTGERPFKCSQCTKAFTQNQARTVHMRTHTGERPIQCSKCSKSFRQMSNLIVHLRRYPKHK